MRVRNFFLFSALVVLLLFFEMFISSCASQASPSGGPKDTIAPKLDTAFPPNMSTNFIKKEVTLVFNEYVQLKSPGQQISFSPPLKSKPTIAAKAREVTINWKEDTLLDNTTYIISFGNSITDFTEGNVNEKIKYVFSTGDFIDSLSLNGTVFNSADGEPAPKIMVALYDYNTLKSTDSIPFKNLPTYYTYTDENGHFSLENLKYSNFHVIAFEDQRGNFKMSTGTEKAAFLKDTVSTSLNHDPLKLLAFSPQSPDRYYGARQTGKGKVEFAFNYPPKGLEVNFLDTALESVFHFLSLADRQDTATLWFSEMERDTLTFIVKENGKIIDTTVVTLRDFKVQQFGLTLKDEQVKYNEPLVLKASLPVKAVYDSLMWVYDKKDTLTVTATAHKDNPVLVTLQPEKRLPEYKLLLKKGAVENIFGAKSDSLVFDIKGLKREDLGNLDFTIKADSVSALVLHVFNPQNEKIVDTAFTGNLTLNFRNMKPGIYTVSLIIDENGDGKWTTGNYLERRQPERILTYKEKAEIRANWDLELEWVPEITPSQSSVNESRSDKN